MSFTDDEKARGLDPKHVPQEPGAAAHSDVLVGTGLDDGGDYVLVYPPDGRTAETAQQLNLAAAGQEQLVQWTGEAFRVPKHVADAATLTPGAKAVDRPQNSGGSSSPTVRESGFGNVAPGVDGNHPAVVTQPPPGATPPAGDPTGSATAAPAPAKAPAAKAAKAAGGAKAADAGAAGGSTSASSKAGAAE